SSTSALTLNGGTIKDSAGNNAILTLLSPGAAGSLAFNSNIVIDTTAPAAPAVSSPNASHATSSASVTVSGTAESNALVKVWTDATKTVLAGSQQLTGGATAYSINATLAGNTVNNLVVTATDLPGNQSAATAVPAITQD